MAKTSKQEAHALITYFLDKYAQVIGGKPKGLNRFALATGFESFYLDYEDNARAIIDYYIETYDDPSPRQFIFRYGDVADEWEEDQKDDAYLRSLYIRTSKELRGTNE